MSEPTCDTEGCTEPAAVATPRGIGRLERRCWEHRERPEMRFTRSSQMQRHLDPITCRSCRAEPSFCRCQGGPRT